MGARGGEGVGGVGEGEGNGMGVGSGEMGWGLGWEGWGEGRGGGGMGGCLCSLPLSCKSGPVFSKLNPYRNSSWELGFPALKPFSVSLLLE